MITVGLDITRLGLMLVQGQPKTAAEYIQTTSRVGRDHRRLGLVVAVLNVHKPRDRMHLEQFGQFQARALDCALAAIVVAAARHIDPALTPESSVDAIPGGQQGVALRRQRLRAVGLRDPDIADQHARPPSEKAASRVQSRAGFRNGFSCELSTSGAGS
jgi:hypothetical protein